MAMGRRQKITNGLEYDYVTRWRHVLVWKQGMKRAISRQLNRRARKEARLRLRKER